MAKRKGPPKVGPPKVKARSFQKGDLVQWLEDNKPIKGFIVAMYGPFLGDGTVEVRERGETLGTYQHISDLKRLVRREDMKEYWRYL